MSKKIAVLFIWFIAQIIYSACCKNTSSAYERTFKSVSLSAWNTLGYHDKIVNGTVPKFAFGLGIYFQFDDRQISFNSPNSNVGSFGFNSAMATKCISPRNSYKYLDHIDSIEIVVVDLATDERINISKDFYASKNTTLNEQIIEDNRTGYDKPYYSYLVDLIEDAEVPDSVIFEVSVYLSSGITLTSRTDQINFT